MTTFSTTRWRLAAAMGALLLGGLLTYTWLNGPRSIEFDLGSFTLVESAAAATTPVVDQSVAAGAAQQRLDVMNPSVRNLSLTGSHLAVGLKTIQRTGGDLVYSSSPEEDSWVFEYEGPAQNGFKTVEALVVVSAKTGEVVSAQILQSN